MDNIKIGVIGIPGKWSTETLADAVEARTGFRLVINMGEVALNLVSGELMYEHHDLCKLDALLVKKISAEYSPNTLDRLDLLRVAEQAGVRVFSKAQNIHRLVNRLSCTITLRNHDIPMPDTCVTESVEKAIETVIAFGSAVFKPFFSTKARGMVVIEAASGRNQIEQQVREFQSSNAMMYIQKKVDLPGQDMGLVYLGGVYQGAYARVSQSDSWNTTIRSGGRYQDIIPEDNIIELASRAQAPFGMDFTTVDVAETTDGPIIFEVSAFGGFRGSLEGSGIKMAERYVDYALLELKGE